MARYLAVSYDPDEQQWFWDIVEGPENEAETVQAYVSAARPYVVAVDAVALDELKALTRNVADQGPTWRVEDTLTECADCGTINPASKLHEIDDFDQRVDAGEEVPAGQCPDCGALCHFKE